MKTYMQDKQKPNYVMNSSFVLCSCSAQPPKGTQGDNKYDIDNFEFYRVLKATEPNNGVYGGDNPIINETDCVPHINIEPFKNCRSKFYFNAVRDIALHAFGEMEKYSQGSEEYSYWYSKYYNYQEILRYTSSSSGIYPCVMELLDSWFNTDDKTLMSNAIEKLEEAKKKQKDTYDNASANLNSMEDKLDEYCKVMRLELEKEAAKSIETAAIGTWGKVIVLLDKPRNVLYPGEHYYVLSFAKMDSRGNVIRGGICSETPVLEYEDFTDTDSYKEWKADDDELNSIKTLINQLKTGIKEWKEDEVKTYVISDDELTDTYDGTSDEEEKVYIDDMDVILNEISSLRSIADQITTGFEKYEETAGKYKVKRFCDRLRSEFAGIYNDLDNLYTEIEVIRSEIYKRTTVTEDSFLVCRCGGVIKVVINGEWVQQSNEMVKPNLIELLTYIEGDLFAKLKPNDSEDIRYSIIDAFNMTHETLLALSEQEQTNYDFIVDEGCENSQNELPAIEIIISPMKEIMEKKKTVLGILNATTFLPYVGPYIQLALVFNDVVNYGDVSLFGGVTDAEAVASIVLSEAIKPKYMGNASKEVAKGLGNLSAGMVIIANAVSLWGALSNLLYKSYAYFVGEIKVNIYTFNYKYQYYGRYDIQGNKIDAYSYNRSTSDGSIYRMKIPRGNNLISFNIYDGSYFQKEDNIENTISLPDELGN